MKFLISVKFFIISSFCVLTTRSQFPTASNAIFGPNSILRGVKNVIGGIVKFDAVHSKCLQKTMCSEFSDEIVANDVELDPVKRTWVYKPKLIQRKGRLRWLGDILANGVSRMARRIGFAPTNRRQSPTLLGSAASFALSSFGKVPLDSIVQ